jgi:hypothetical protein
MANFKAKSARDPGPLIGRWVKLLDHTEGYYSVVMITADLGGGFLLARRRSCTNGRDLGVSIVLSLHMLAIPDAAELYDDFAALQSSEHEMDETAEKVVSLVPRR